MAARSSTRSTSGVRRPSTSAHEGGDRPKPVRVTVDLDPDDYDALRDWAHFARMSHSDVLRALVQLLTSDESVAAAVRSA